VPLKKWRTEAIRNNRKEEIAILEERMKAIEKAISTTSSNVDVYRALHYRYILGMELKAIAKKTNFSIATVSRNLKKGLKMINHA